MTVSEKNIEKLFLSIISNKGHTIESNAKMVAFVTIELARRAWRGKEGSFEEFIAEEFPEIKK